MQDLLALLQKSIFGTQQDGEVIAENMRASRSSQPDVMAAIEARVKAEESHHRQFSCFTPDNGKA